MSELRFKFKAFEHEGETVIIIIMDGVKAEFRYTDPEGVASLAENMQQIIEYAIDDYTINQKFKKQLENDLQEWINNEGSN